MPRKLRKIALASVVLLSVVTLAYAAEMADKAHPGVFAPNDITWGPAPPFLPPGAQAAILEGDPAQAGLYTVRLSMPDGYQIPAHHHPTTEHVTVISGEFHLGMGDKLDTAKGTALPAGSFGYLPAEMHHFAWAKGATVVQVHGMGPFAITYVNPADDPRNAKP
jgi:quercetin dioxygenase-like cupin family protein